MRTTDRSASLFKALKNTLSLVAVLTVVVACSDSKKTQTPPEDYDKESRKIIKEIEETYHFKMDDYWFYDKEYEQFTEQTFVALTELKNALQSGTLNSEDYSAYMLSNYGDPKSVFLSSNNILTINSSATAEGIRIGLKYHPKYNFWNIHKIVPEIIRLKTQLESITEFPVKIDWEFTDTASIMWVLNSLLNYANQSEEHRETIKKLNFIEITNINDVFYAYYFESTPSKIFADVDELIPDLFQTRISNQDSTIKSSPFNYNDLVRFVESVASQQERHQRVVERLRNLKKLLSLKSLSFTSVITDIDVVESVVVALENEAARPDNGLRALEKIHIAAGSSLTQLKYPKLHYILFLCAYESCTDSNETEIPKLFQEVQSLMPKVEKVQ